MRWQDILPVLLSIIVIIAVAVLEKQSKFIAAITATMPLTAALAAPPNAMHLRGALHFSDELNQKNPRSSQPDFFIMLQLEQPFSLPSPSPLD